MTDLNIININMDVPVELKARTNVYNIETLYLFNFTYKVVAVNHVIVSIDGGDDHYNYVNTYPIMEISGGLAYYDFGWKIFDNKVQEKYANYVAENEILKG